MPFPKKVDIKKKSKIFQYFSNAQVINIFNDFFFCIIHSAVKFQNSARIMSESDQNSQNPQRKGSSDSPEICSNKITLNDFSPEGQDANHSSTSTQNSKTANSLPACSRRQFMQTSNDPGLYNWQESKSNIKDRISYLFNKELLSNITFIVGKGSQQQQIPAHKFVLSVGSPVFDALFNGPMATENTEIELPDVEPTAFLSLLCFLYSDVVKIGPDSVMTTLYTAKKYAVPALEKACVDFLTSHLNSDNAFLLLTQARLFDEPQLGSLCLETIDKNTSESLAADGFTDIDLETLCVVLNRDTLRIREAKLFEAVVRWAEAECVRKQLPVNHATLRSVLEKPLTLVRFPLMTVEEFANGPAQSSILNENEIVKLFLHFIVNPKPKVPFNDTPRSCVTGKEQAVCRFQQVESRWGYSGTSDRIRFMVDKKIYVIGFGLYGSIFAPAEYEVSIQILHSGSGRLCGSHDTTFTSDGSTETNRVMFTEPIEILPTMNYTACATLKGCDSHYGTKGLRKVTVNSIDGGNVIFHFTYAAGNNNGTSVEDGQIPEIIFYT
ncbi:BTB/POZ domain-containing protein 2 [Nymphon striatum]|nr:BTB/POZ domain-containing protein 2 [Nymphon striatum]